MTTQKVIAIMIFAIAMFYIFLRPHDGTTSIGSLKGVPKQQTSLSENFRNSNESKTASNYRAVASTPPQGRSPTSKMQGSKFPKTVPRNDVVDYDSERQAKDEIIQKYDSGQLLVHSGGTFKILNLRAIPKSSYKATMKPPIAEKFGMLIYSVDPNAGFGSGFGLSNGGKPVVAKDSNGIIGIVTGTIIVRLKDSSTFVELATRYGISSIYFDANLNLAFYSAPLGVRLDELVQSLKQDPSIEDAQLEILLSEKRV